MSTPPLDVRIQSLLHAELEPWTTQVRPLPSAVLGENPTGSRDLMWCPYLNEPAILEWKDNKPHCPNCDGNFEAVTHTFLGHILKPR